MKLRQLRGGGSKQLSRATLRNPGPRGRGVRGPDCFWRKSLDTYLRVLKPDCGPPGPIGNILATGSFSSQGGSPHFSGVLVGPPPPFASAIKCHQKSTSNSAGSSVGSLAPPPPGHPAAGRCGRVVPVLPLLLCTLPARARPSVGGQSTPPAPRQLPWSPPPPGPRTHCPFNRFFVLETAVFHFEPYGSKTRLGVCSAGGAQC
jgi:hypothetical protein